MKFKNAKRNLTAHQFSMFLIGYLGTLAKEAEPIMRQYAKDNPKHEWEGKMQDPHGVHSWLTRFDAMAKEVNP